MRTAIAAGASALLMALTLVACTTGDADDKPITPTPDGTASGLEALPGQEEACDFLVGVGARDFGDYSGTDMTAFVPDPDAVGLVDGGDEYYDVFEPMLEMGGLFCALEQAGAGQPAIFAWAPVEEESRETVIARIEEFGYTRAESEGGSLMTMAEGVSAEPHIVTNDGWYYSTQDFGAEYLRGRFED